MSRAAFLMDRVMAKTGLEGRAFVAMLSSYRLRDPGHHGHPDAAVVARPDRHHRHRAADDLLGAAAGLHVAGRAAGGAADPVVGIQRAGRHDVPALPGRRVVRAGRGAAGQVDDSARRSAAVHHGASALPAAVPAGDAGRDVERGQHVPAQSGNHHPGHLTGVVGAAQSARPGGADPGHVHDRCHRVRDEPQLCRRCGSCCRTGVFATGLRLAHRHRAGRFALSPRSIRLDAGSGGGGDRSRKLRSKRWPP